MTWLEPIEIISGFTTPNFFVFPKPFPPLLLSLLIHCDVDIFSGLYPVFILQNYAWTRSVNWPWGKITQIFNNNKQTSGSNSSFLKTSQSEIRLSLVFHFDFNYRHKNHLFFFFFSFSSFLYNRSKTKVNNDDNDNFYVSFEK